MDGERGLSTEGDCVPVPSGAASIQELPRRNKFKRGTWCRGQGWGSAQRPGLAEAGPGPRGWGGCSWPPLCPPSTPLRPRRGPRLGGGGRGRTMAGSGAPRFVRRAAQTAASSGRHGDGSWRLRAPRGLQTQPWGALPGLGALLGGGPRPRPGRPGTGRRELGSGMGHVSRAGWGTRCPSPRPGRTLGDWGPEMGVATPPPRGPGGRSGPLTLVFCVWGCLRTHLWASGPAQGQPSPFPSWAQALLHRSCSCLWSPPLGEGGSHFRCPNPMGQGPDRASQGTSSVFVKFQSIRRLLGRSVNWLHHPVGSPFSGFNPGALVPGPPRPLPHCPQGGSGGQQGGGQ